MPRLRHEYDVLPAALRFYLVHGTLPPDGSRDRGEGLVEAFTMKHAWLDRGRQPKAIADLRRLWAEHRAEIEQAAGGVRRGWPWRSVTRHRRRRGRRARGRRGTRRPRRTRNMTTASIPDRAHRRVPDVAADAVRGDIGKL
jgi:hypothetical protein